MAWAEQKTELPQAGDVPPWAAFVPELLPRLFRGSPMGHPILRVLDWPASMIVRARSLNFVYTYTHPIGSVSPEKVTTTGVCFFSINYFKIFTSIYVPIILKTFSGVLFFKSCYVSHNQPFKFTFIQSNYWSIFLQISFVYCFLSWTDVDTPFLLHISNFSFVFLYYFSLICPSSSLILSLPFSMLLFSLYVVFLIQIIIISIHKGFYLAIYHFSYFFYYLYPHSFLWNDGFKFLFYIPFIWPCLACLYRLFSF